MEMSKEVKTAFLELTGIMQLLQGQDGDTTSVLDVSTYVVAVSRVYPVFSPVFGTYAWVSAGIFESGKTALSAKVRTVPHAWMNVQGLDDVTLDLLPVNQVLGAKTPVLIEVSRLSKIGISGFLQDKDVTAPGPDSEPHILTAVQEVERLRERARRLIITV